MNTTFDQQKHPEKQPKEVWVANMGPSFIRWVGWSSKRAGLVAYNNKGEVVSDKVPVFAAKRETEAAGLSGEDFTLDDDDAPTEVKL